MGYSETTSAIFRHERARRELALTHRASHEMLRRNLVSCVKREIKYMNYSGAQFSSDYSAAYRMSNVEEIIADHQAMLVSTWLVR